MSRRKLFLDLNLTQGHKKSKDACPGPPMVEKTLQEIWSAFAEVFKI